MKDIPVAYVPPAQEDRKSINATTPQDWDAATQAIHDAVHKPAHYNAGDIETIDYIKDVLIANYGIEGYLGYLHGSALKYSGTRLTKKGKPVQDSRKCIWYMNKLAEALEDEGV